MKQCCTELPLLLFSLCPMVELVHETVLYRGASTSSLLLVSHGGISSYETVLYRGASTSSLLLVSHGGITCSSCIPLDVKPDLVRNITTRNRSCGQCA